VKKVSHPSALFPPHFREHSEAFVRGFDFVFIVFRDCLPLRLGEEFHQFLLREIVSDVMLPFPFVCGKLASQLKLRPSDGIADMRQRIGQLRLRNNRTIRNRLRIVSWDFVFERELLIVVV